ncbi:MULTISPECIES: Uma2 family endonuclease [Nostoc]|uniref:Uma2 family endonuclease n=1 Tax=Nostoc paludosum FACHB-159 TaxID=2692908 RepID=A0ABR8KK78_9NOSO|nr:MULTISPECIES: Uma2 family endonuclease [Nostoc]MBD2682784.1 Uma2 family endonuclease [Nostoc sp. FACHB-857]MBD2739119.1 Uma2 family endonuclease [Nostoc paludosum FACHB-159]
MTQALPKSVTFDEFVEWYPNDGKRYELHNGVIVEVPPPTGQHEKVVGFIARKLTVEFDRLNLPYTIPKTALVKTPSAESAYSPDVLLLNLDNLDNEPLFQKYSTVRLPASVPLVVEVVSTNWRDDYHDKFGDYEEMGIPEYWIADYAALGGRKFIGNPKQPTIFVCELVDGEYQMNPFQGNTAISSRTFPQLNLTAQQIFDAAN